MKIIVYHLSFIVCIIIFCFLNSCNSQSKEKVHIKGEIIDFANQKIELYQLKIGNHSLINSTEATNDGQFSFSFSPNESGFFIIQNPKKKNLVLVVEKGEVVEIKGSINKFTVKGSPHSELFQKFNLHVGNGLKTVDSIRMVLVKSQSKKEFPEIKTRLDSLFTQLYVNQQNHAKKIVENNPSSLANLLIINKKFANLSLFDIQKDFELLAKTDSLLTLKYPTNPLVADFHKKVTTYRKKNNESTKKQIQTGNLAPELELPNNAGRMQKLSSLRGKTVLLYFWASWNPISRTLNRDLTAIYNQFKTNNFEIFAVSLDENPNLWNDAIKKDKAYWIQVCDLKSLNSPAVSLYGTQNLPQIFLIDKTGKIVAKNIGIEDLKAFLLTKQ